MFPPDTDDPRTGSDGTTSFDGMRLSGQSLAALKALAAADSGDHERFFRHCVESLARSYAVDAAWISAFDDAARGRLRSVAAWWDDGHADSFDSDTRGSPCQHVIELGQLYIGAGVCANFPQCAWLQERGFDAYVGTVLRDVDDVACGVLAIAHRGPFDAADDIRCVMDLYAGRVAEALRGWRATRESRWLASVFEHSPQGIMITDVEHRIRRVNEAFVAITGWREEDVLGRLDSVLSAGRDPSDLHATVRATLDVGGVWSGELWSRRRDGEVYPEQRTVVAVRAAGGVSHYINLFSDISGEKFTAERIHRLAHFDATTELPNRVLLQDRLLHGINAAARVGGRLVLLFLDLDGFKFVNDTRGHAAGDEVLRRVGERLRSRLRKEDLVARIGGDEFAVVLADVQRRGDVEAICEQLLSVIAEPYEFNGEQSHVSSSIGIALYPDDGRDVQSLLKHADTAMYQAKESGKNCYVFYQREMNRSVEERQQLVQDLRRSLYRGDLYLYFQPQYELGSGRVVAVEALVRWNDARGDMVPPTRFIPVAEDSGLINELGDWVLHEACRRARQWLEQGLDFGRLSVNVSGRQFHNEKLRHTVADALDANGLPAERLALEISESWVMEGPYRAEHQMRELRDMGIDLVVDDFGQANLSMAYLKRFPVHKLKIDQAFIRDIPDDPDDAAIVSAMVAMGHSLNLRVLAEGVETAEQSAFLRSIGCDEAQGFLFARPVPADELNVLLLYGPTLSPSQSSS